MLRAGVCVRLVCVWGMIYIKDGVCWRLVCVGGWCVLKIGMCWESVVCWGARSLWCVLSDLFVLGAGVCWRLVCAGSLLFVWKLECFGVC